jgi:hypothetical protein
MWRVCSESKAGGIAEMILVRFTIFPSWISSRFRFTNVAMAWGIDLDSTTTCYLRYTDLYITRPKCRTCQNAVRAKWKPQREKEYFQMKGLVMGIFGKAEKKCPRCDGSKINPIRNVGNGNCSSCHGTKRNNMPNLFPWQDMSCRRAKEQGLVKYVVGKECLALKVDHITEKLQ